MIVETHPRCEVQAALIDSEPEAYGTSHRRRRGLLTARRKVLHWAARLRLAVPLAWALIVPTLFHQWYYAHCALANGIWYAMLVLVALSWVASLVRWLRR